VTERVRAALCVEGHGDHVEADLAPAELGTAQEHSCSGLEVQALAAIHAEFRRVTAASTGLHFGQHQRAISRVGGEQIDLEVSQSKVARQHPVPKAFKERCRGLLGGLARRFAAIGLGVDGLHAERVTARGAMSGT